MAARDNAGRVSTQRQTRRVILLVLMPVRLPVLVFRTICGGLLSFGAMVLRRPAVPPGAVAITHSRSLRALLWLSLPADTIAFLVLGLILETRVPAASPYVTGVGVVAFLFVLGLVSDLTRSPHYVTKDGLTIRLGRRKSWMVRAESIAGVSWSSPPSDQIKASGQAAVLDPSPQVRIDLKDGHQVAGLPEGIRQVWFGADEKSSADHVRKACVS